MAHREFTDSDGTAWQAWEVIPSSAERRKAGERRFGHRDVSERRTRHEPRVRFDAGLAEGWLVFECAAGKRRLHPIPAGWSTLSDAELAALARSARATTGR